jgi:hypothetical protein
MAIQAALDKHTKEGLFNTLKTKKKSYSRGKRLNILSKKYTKPVLFSTPNILKAQAILTKKEEKRGKNRRESTLIKL